MNMSIGAAISNPSSTALERVIKLLLDEASEAYQQGDSRFLEATNITAAQAQQINKIDRRRLAKLLCGQEASLSILVDQQTFTGLLSETIHNANLVRQRRELINAGATHAMLNELGIVIARESGSQRDAISGLVKTHPTGIPEGRPPNLDTDTIRALHTYWASIRNPGRIDPVDHLLRTAEHLDIRVVRIWNYIQAYPGGRHRSAPVGAPDWITIIFPAWPNQEKCLCDRGGR